MGFGSYVSTDPRRARWVGIVVGLGLLTPLAGCGGSAIPFNVESFLTIIYTGSNKPGFAVHSPAWHVEQMTGETQWIGSNTLPGTLAIGAPNAQGAVMVTWVVRGKTFKWLVSQNGEYAVPENARSRAALGA